VISPDVFRDIVAEARLAPSVHNIQPTRFGLAAPDRILLHAAPERRLSAADPSGHDVLISHGAALEGLAIALRRRGLRVAATDLPAGELAPRHPVAEIAVASGGEADPLQPYVGGRASWRGAYAPATPAALAAIPRDDLIVVEGREAVRGLAAEADAAGFHFVRQADHRRELLAWMRLSRRHPDYHRDGLNAEALALSPLEALGASWVLGPLFPILAALGLAKTLTRDAKVAGASAFALFHRPQGEHPVETGRAFYRTWLEITRAGLSACPVSVLSDHPGTNARLRSAFGVPPDRRLVNVFKVGVPAAPRRISHVRLPVDELIVSGG
jgi:nitroreductase